MPLLQRKYRLTIGAPSVTTFVSDQFTEQEVFGIQDIPVAEDYRTVTLNAVEITDLDISATVSSNAGNGGSKTNLTIYNMASETREIVEKVNNYVILEAGFESDEELKTIFTGQVSEFSTERVGQDLATKLVCTDGYVPNNTIRVSKTFPEGTTADQVFKYIIAQYKKAGVSLGQYVSDLPSVYRKVMLGQIKPPAKTVFELGYSLSGYLIDELNDLCKSLGYTHYITNGRLFIHPVSYTKTVEQFEVSTDQLYSIRRSGKGGGTTNAKQDIGVDVSLALDGRMGVDKQIKVLDGDYAGTYKILSCGHSINYRGGNFDTKLKCKQVDT